MALYPFARSSACLCTTGAVQWVHDLAAASRTATTWALIAVGALFVGALFASMELAADKAMLLADQLFLKVVKRKSSRWVGWGPPQQQEHE